MAPEKCIADPSRDCLGLAKAEMLEKQIAEYRQQSRETHSELYTRITALEKSDAKRDEQYSKILDKLNDMQADINKALYPSQSLRRNPENAGTRLWTRFSFWLLQPASDIS